MRTICIPIDRRNECREKRHPGHECGGGIGKDGDPMYSLTASMGGHFEPAVCLWEEVDMIVVGLSDRITPWALKDMMPTLRAVDWKAPPIVAMEIGDDDHIHMGQPERMGMGKGGTEDACSEDCHARQVGDMRGARGW